MSAVHEVEPFRLRCSSDTFPHPREGGLVSASLLDKRERLFYAAQGGKTGHLTYRPGLLLQIFWAEAGEFTELFVGDELIFLFAQSFFDGADNGASVGFASTGDVLNVFWIDDESIAFHGDGVFFCRSNEVIR